MTILALLKKMDEDIPPVFMLLDTFEKEVRNLLPGEHLFCVYGDNWFQSVKYNLRVLVAEPRQELLNIWTEKILFATWADIGLFSMILKRRQFKISSVFLCHHIKINPFLNGDQSESSILKFGLIFTH